MPTKIPRETFLNHLVSKTKMKLKIIFTWSFLISFFRSASCFSLILQFGALWTYIWYKLIVYWWLEGNYKHTKPWSYKDFIKVRILFRKLITHISYSVTLWITEFKSWLLGRYKVYYLWTSLKCQKNTLKCKEDCELG